MHQSMQNSFQTVTMSEPLHLYNPPCSASTDEGTVVQYFKKIKNKTDSMAALNEPQEKKQSRFQYKETNQEEKEIKKRGITEKGG